MPPDVQAKITAMWGRASGRYDTHVGHGLNSPAEEEAWTEALVNLLPPPPADVLDVGTGTGVIAMLLSRLGYSVRGIDLSDKMLSRARRKASGSEARVVFEAGDAMDPPGAPESVDIVISRHLVHLLTQPARALKSWHRLLRSGGHLVIIDGLWGQDPDDRIPDDIQSWLPLRAPAATTDDLRRLAEGAGFVEVVLGDLAEIDRIERELATVEDPAPNVPHYVVTARKPSL